MASLTENIDNPFAQVRDQTGFTLGKGAELYVGEIQTNLTAFAESSPSLSEHLSKDIKSKVITLKGFETDNGYVCAAKTTLNVLLSYQRSPVSSFRGSFISKMLDIFLQFTDISEEEMKIRVEKHSVKFGKIIYSSDEMETIVSSLAESRTEHWRTQLLVTKILPILLVKNMYQISEQHRVRINEIAFGLIQNGQIEVRNAAAASMVSIIRANDELFLKTLIVLLSLSLFKLIFLFRTRAGQLSSRQRRKRRESILKSS